MSDKDAKKAAAPAAAEAAPKSGMMKKLMIGGAVAVLVLGQLAAVMLLFPSSSESSEPEHASVDKQVEHEVEKEDSHHADHSEHAMEMDLGQFGVTAFQPTSNVTLRIDFHLFATVKEAEEPEFQEMYKRSMNRVREQVIITMRTAELTDLTDAGLGLIKRRILTKVNTTLGKPLLQSVIISDFSFMEQ